MLSGITRRRFLKHLGVGGTVLAGLPTLLPQSVFAEPGKPGANEVVNIALVGTGVRAWQIAANLPPTCRIVAVCDVELPEAQLATKQLDGTWKVYQNYRDILDKEPVDGIVFCNCDHNRILPAIHACQASKDIYVEKPFSLYVTEGRALVQAVGRYQRVCQTGTQSRTIGMNQAALRMIREGTLGKLKSIVCRNYPSVGPIAVDPNSRFLRDSIGTSGVVRQNYSATTKLHIATGHNTSTIAVDRSRFSAPMRMT